MRLGNAFLCVFCFEFYIAVAIFRHRKLSKCGKCDINASLMEIENTGLGWGWPNKF